MKSTFALLIVLLLAVSNQGCAYLYNRWRDAGDIFTASAGSGYGGVKVRFSSLQLALFQNRDLLGLRGGRLFFFPNEAIIEETASPFVDLYHGAYQVDVLYLSHPNNDPRNKDYAAYGPFIFMIIDDNKPQLTQIEVAVGLGGTLRLGFNPGELLDFILGWTTIDIYGDDIGIIKSNESLQPTETRNAGFGG